MCRERRAAEPVALVSSVDGLDSEAVTVVYVRRSHGGATMAVRPLLGRVVITGVAAATVLLGSWLLVADPGLGRSRPGGRALGPSAAQGPRPLSHGYGGYGGVCRPASLQVISNPEAFIRGGNVRCFAS